MACRARQTFQPTRPLDTASLRRSRIPDATDVTGKLAEVPVDLLVPSLQTNLLSALYIVQPAIKHLRAAATQENPSRVVMVSSGASVGAYQAWGMYSLAKAGINSLARTLAAEEKDKNVLFLSIRPGVVDVSGARSRRRDVGKRSADTSQTDVSDARTKQTCAVLAACRPYAFAVARRRTMLVLAKLPSKSPPITLPLDTYLFGPPLRLHKRLHRSTSLG